MCFNISNHEISHKVLYCLDCHDIYVTYKQNNCFVQLMLIYLILSLQMHQFDYNNSYFHYGSILFNAAKIFTQCFRR